MKLSLRFFASLRDALDCASEEIETPLAVMSVLQLRQWLAARGGAWEALTTQKTLRAAIDQTMIPPSGEASTLLHDGAEVAFFPPVTGG